MLALPVALKGLIDKGMVVGNAATINGYFIAFLGVAVLFEGATDCIDIFDADLTIRGLYEIHKRVKAKR